MTSTPFSKEPALRLTAVGDILPIAVVRTCIKGLLSAEKLKLLDAEFKDSYANLFPTDIPHVSELPTDMLMMIKLCDTQKPMVAHAYSCSQKY